MKNKGITLIALVITIIVLLILAGISIAMLTGENGLLSKTEETQEANRMGTAKEKVELATFASWDEKGKFNREQFKKEIENQGGSIVKEGEKTITGKMDIYQFSVNVEAGKIINFGKNLLSMEYQITPEEGVATPYKNIKIMVKGGEGEAIKIKNDNNGQIIEGSEATFTVEENGDYTFTVTDQDGREIKDTVSISGILKEKILFSYSSGMELPANIAFDHDKYSTASLNRWVISEVRLRLW